MGVEWQGRRGCKSSGSSLKLEPGAENEGWGKGSRVRPDIFQGGQSVGTREAGKRDQEQEALKAHTDPHTCAETYTAA